ncbi:MAG TPA: hypothetical protein VNT52_00110 [Acidimicrobiales bacterium]|nr:hypothetical protein [Acidimicrobiales bacterium]
MVVDDHGEGDRSGDRREVRHRLGSDQREVAEKNGDDAVGAGILGRLGGLHAGADVEGPDTGEHRHHPSGDVHDRTHHVVAHPLRYERQLP